MSAAPPPIPQSALDACASEPIHAPGAVQSFGTLLALDDAGIVIAASANAEALLGGDLVGRPLAGLPKALSTALAAGGRGARPGDLGVHALPGGSRRVAAHRRGGRAVVEFLPDDSDASARTDSAHAVAELLHNTAALVTDRADLSAFASHLVARLRDLTGYERVMAYRFDERWNGSVIAEAKGPAGEPYLGLHYPHTDIPPQSREMYLEARVRVLADVAGDAVPLTGEAGLDIALARCRAMSPVHREYLSNMGVRATLVASIVSGGRLWGLIACHHPEPRYPSWATQALVAGLAELAGAQAALATAAERARGRGAAAAALGSLGSRLDGRTGWAAALAGENTGLTELVGASGLVVADAEGVVTRGDAPDANGARRLVDWLRTRPGPVVATSELGRDAPYLADLAPTVAGVLALQLPGQSGGWLAWVRPEEAGEVRWAGNPRKHVVGYGPAARLTPRTSFATWVESVRGRSRAWGEAELAVAAEVVRPNLLEVLVEWQRRHTRRMDEYYGILFAQVRDAVIVTDLDGVITFWNDGAARLSGRPAAEMLGRSMFGPPGLVGGPDSERVSEAIRREGRYEGEWRMVRADGTERWVRANIQTVLGEDGRPVGFLGVSQDITEARQAQEYLRQSLQRYRMVTDAIGDVVIWHDAAGAIRFVSPSVERLLGRPPSEVVGKTLFELIDPEDLEAGHRGLAAVVSEGTTTIELRLRHQDGRPVWVEVIGGRATDAGGTTDGFVCCARDITPRKALEAQFRQAQKMEAIGHLAGGVAHDFNNLLTVINASAELITLGRDPDDPARQLAEEIHQAGERGAALTRQLLAFGRRQVVRPVPLDLGAVAAELGPILRRLLGESYHLRINASPAPALADRGQLEQVVMNLVVNARDAMPGGGEVALTTGVTPDGRSRLSVSDTGIGIDADTRARLFEPFFTTKELGKGTGLGLATVHGIVREARGEVVVESEPGRGSRFDVLLPAAPPPALPRPAPEAARATDGGGARVLVAEDDRPVRELIRAVLESSGYRVTAAADGAEALAAFGSGGAPDLLLTDVVMPGMSGPELAARMRVDRPGLRVAFLSAHTEDHALRGGVARGTVHFLQKPFTISGLLALVHDALAG